MRSRDIEWVDHPTMSPRNTEQLRPFIERWQTAYLWSNPHRIKPALVNAVFGDGRTLLKLYPIMFRPNHFVVRIDSATNTRHADDWLDDIYEAIEEQFYEWPWAKAYGLTWHEDDGADDDSRLSFADGSSWGEMKWPRLRRRTPKIQKTAF